jgi:preprotein translocase subunit SecA
VAYKNEAFELFRDLMNSIWTDFAQMIYHVEVTPTDENGQPIAPGQQRRPAAAASSATGGGRVTYSGGGAPQGALAMAAAAAGVADAADGYAGEEAEPLPHVEQRRVDENEQLGRNDPCWCGSGKKFKKCHGA